MCDDATCRYGGVCRDDGAQLKCVCQFQVGGAVDSPFIPCPNTAKNTAVSSPLIRLQFPLTRHSHVDIHTFSTVGQDAPCCLTLRSPVSSPARLCFHVLQQDVQIFMFIDLFSWQWEPEERLLFLDSLIFLRPSSLLTLHWNSFIFQEKGRREKTNQRKKKSEKKKSEKKKSSSPSLVSLMNLHQWPAGGWSYRLTSVC